MSDIISLDQVSVQNHIDHLSYDQWSKIESEVLTPVDKVSEYKKFVIKSYLYIRSRLFVPGKSHEFGEYGPMSIGSSAHAELIDLDIWLSNQDSEIRTEVLDWINDSGLEQVAAARGQRNFRTHHQRRNKALRKLVAESGKI